MKLKQLFVEPTSNTILQLFRYVFVGGCAFLFDFGLLWILTDKAHLHYLLSATLSFLLGLCVNYFFSKFWVFSSSSLKDKKIEFFIFALIGIVGLGLNNLFLWIFTTIFSIHYLLSKIITTGIVFFLNFFARKQILFSVRRK